MDGHRNRGIEGGTVVGKEGRRDGGTEGGREGGRDGRRDGGRDGGREGRNMKESSLVKWKQEVRQTVQEDNGGACLQA